MNKPIAIDGYMSAETIKSIVNFHPELYKQSNYQKLLINILTYQFESKYYKGIVSPALAFSSFATDIKSDEALELFIT